MGTIKDWLGNIHEWEGTAADMEKRIASMAKKSGWSDSESPSVRLIRHYTQLGILDRPERRGKEAIYSYRQVVQLFVARWLLQDGWKLSKIAEITSAQSTTELLELVPAQGLESDAGKLIQRFRTESSTPVPRKRRAKKTVSLNKVRETNPVTQMNMERTSKRGRLQDGLVHLGNTDGRVNRRDVQVIELTPWCQLLIDQEQLKRLSTHDVTVLGEALATALYESKRIKL